MSLFKWDDTYFVNINEIDLQHQNLVVMLNKLAESMADGHGKDALNEILDGLLDYTLSHFQTEEKIFMLINYPETESHKKEHLDFVQQITKFKEELSKRKLGLSIDVLNYLCDWLKIHITKSDKSYAQFIDEQDMHELISK